MLVLKTDHPGYYQSVLRLFDPDGNKSVKTHLEISTASSDYWNDPPARSASAERAFAGEATSFESRFIRKRLPIHYLELSKRGRAGSWEGW